MKTFTLTKTCKRQQQCITSTPFSLKHNSNPNLIVHKKVSVWFIKIRHYNISINLKN